MVLYYHTASLNLSKMLTTNIISPARFYAQRGFGAKRYFMIPKEYPDFLLLYTTPHAFDLDCSDESIEQYPLIVQLEVDESCVTKINEKVYVSMQSIYLKPETTEFYMPTEEAENIVKVRARVNYDTKFLSIYEELGKFHVLDFSLYSNLPTVVLPDELLTYEIPYQYIQNDKRYNAIRGALYAYALTLADREEMFLNRMGLFIKILHNTALNHVDYSGYDPVFVIALMYILNNPLNNTKERDNSQTLEYLEQLQGIVSVMRCYSNYKNDFNLLIAAFKDTGFQPDIFKQIQDKTVKAIYIVFKRYYNWNELANLQESYFPNGHTLVTVFQWAYLGFSTYPNNNLSRLNTEQKNYLEKVAQELHETNLKYQNSKIARRGQK